jgi:hypothetical protein
MPSGHAAALNRTHRNEANSPIDNDCARNEIARRIAHRFQRRQPPSG